MRKKFINYSLLIIACLLILSACTKSEQETIKDIETSIHSIFNEKKILPNQTLSTFSFYLPSNLKIDEKGNNNAILKYGDQLFILFVNPNEKKDSQLNYQADLKNKDRRDILKKIETKSAFTYVMVKPQKTDNQDIYQLIISSGGNKISTQTDLKRLNTSAEIMAKIIHSITLN